MTQRRPEHLTDEQVEHFLSRGHVTIPQCFSPQAAETYTRDLWVRLGYDAHDKATWAEGRVHMPVQHRIEVKEFAPRAWGAICDLVGGEANVKQPCTWGDGFIANFGESDHADTWEAPSPQVKGWHKDGDWFKHFLDSPEQGLLTIVLWSDVLPKGGATFLAADSVPLVARFMAEHPEGVRPGGFPFKDLINQCSDFVEATGRIGDVVLLHPYVLHASSKNALRLPRLITNPAVSLNEPMRLDRPDGNYSLVEQAILRGLGVDRFAFAPASERELITPERVLRQRRMLDEGKARLAALAA